MQDKLTLEEQKILLRLAREAMERGVKGEELPALDPSSLPSNLREAGSSFITLTMHGQLRGCIGSLDPYESLAEDVREHAVAAALNDPRFPPVREDELNGIQIEVSRLTRPIRWTIKMQVICCPNFIHLWMALSCVILRTVVQHSFHRSGKKSPSLRVSEQSLF
jgi:uncharacterized protein (TIGR00296 family)